ncbi:MAG: hypothetical protein KGZ69_02850 [Methylomonas sp.]|nr:hypothetical protein [Methylomonas sp.]
MTIEIMITVAVTVIIQLVFGAGILLFGTPLSIIWCEFVDVLIVLIVLLPLSLAVILELYSRKVISWAMA